jgi:hypothetical protein
MLYPNFGVDTAEAATPDGRIILPPGTNADSQVFAIQLYNQLSFLYQRSKEMRMIEL